MRQDSVRRVQVRQGNAQPAHLYQDNVRQVVVCQDSALQGEQVRDLAAGRGVLAALVAELDGPVVLAGRAAELDDLAGLDGLVVRPVPQGGDRGGAQAHLRKERRSAGRQW